MTASQDRDPGERSGALAARHRQEIWPDHRSQRRRPRRPAGRGDRAARRKRRRQVDGRLDHLRSRPADHGIDDLARTSPTRPTRRPTRCRPASASSTRRCDSCSTCRSPRTCLSGACPMRGGRIDRELMNRRAAEQLHRLGLDVVADDARARPSRRRAAAGRDRQGADPERAPSDLRRADCGAWAREETERLFEQIGRLKAEGVSFIYISHRLDEIARIADRIVVLRDGSLVATHDTAQVPGEDAGRGDGRPHRSIGCSRIFRRRRRRRR